ncbi:hypothetical protein [Sphingomonas sp. GC_Shp_4]|uniref:hypothetical protein n=1 Tax=Sphingomonas sp. GC_Shp_4 TaxID=2937382 RepID=UPI00226B2981|nr:hypothetical protein [Sphingomonas sp. GC_Shp_4]
MFLLFAVVLAFVGGNGPWILIATVVLAAAAGTRLPDLDTPLRLGHRSALVHSILPLVVALLDRRTWPVAAGLGFGIGCHLAADMFPNTMRGFATIKLPLWGSIGAMPSYLWIAGNAAANLIGGLVVLDRIAPRDVVGGALAATGVLGVAYLMRAQGGWYALGILAVLGWLAFR